MLTPTKKRKQKNCGCRRSHIVDNYNNNNFAVNSNILTNIYNNGSLNYIINNRAYSGYSLSMGGNATGGLYIGSIDPNNSVGLFGKVINSYPTGFSYATPSLPATGVYSSFVNFDIRVYIIDAGTTSGYKLTDTGGTTQSFSTGLYNGQAIDLPAGWTLAIDYSSAPTWRWAQI